MLSPAHRRALRARAHLLKPVVLVGQHGVSEPVLAEIDRALDDHELIKIRFRGGAREARAEGIARICDTLAADLVQSIGGTAVLHRRRPEAHAERSIAS